MHRYIIDSVITNVPSINTSALRLPATYVITDLSLDIKFSCCVDVIVNEIVVDLVARVIDETAVTVVDILYPVTVVAVANKVIDDFVTGVLKTDISCCVTDITDEMLVGILDITATDKEAGNMFRYLAHLRSLEFASLKYGR